MEKIVKEYQSKNRNIFKNFLDNIKPGHLFIFAIIVIILIKITSNPNIDIRYHYVIYAFLIGVIILIASKSSNKKVLLDKSIVMKIAQEELNRMVNEGSEFAYDSKVYLSGKCNLLFTDNMATGYADYTSWDVGFVEQVQGSQYKKDGVIRIHPYTGIILGIIDMPLGYTGKEKRDKEIIPVGIVMGTQKTTDIASGGTTH